MKHLAMNSFSNWRALLDSAFFKTFLRLVPRRPGEANLRMFSLFRLILSFLALMRDDINSVEETRAGLKSAGFGANAYEQAMSNACMVRKGIEKTMARPEGDTVKTAASIKLVLKQAKFIPRH